MNATDVYQKLAASMAKAAHVSVDALTGTSTKASNPKEAFGDAKMPLDLFPDTALVQMNLAFLEGALKYGQYNWRIAGVKVSTYIRAARRHLSKFWNGQDVDPVTLVNELASVGACVAIMLDAMACGKLTDDRPPRADMEHALARAAGVAKHLKVLFKDHTPPQYTEREHGEVAQAAKRHAQYMETMAAPWDVPTGTISDEERAARADAAIKALQVKRAARRAKRRKTATPLPRLMKAVQTAGRRKRR